MKAIETIDRDGWVAECPNGHRFNATMLKSWGGRWVAYYGVRSRFVFIADRRPNVSTFEDHLAASAHELVEWDVNAVAQEAETSSVPHCPVCNVALPFESGNQPNAVLWIEGYVLIDGAIGKMTRLGTVKV